MAEVKSMFLRFTPSDSPDVVTNKMYMEEAPNPVIVDPDDPNLSESFDIGNTLNADGLVEIDIASLPGMTTKDGTYNVGVCAVDDRGNEATPSLLNDVPFDFVAPNPVGALAFFDV